MQGKGLVDELPLVMCGYGKKQEWTLVTKLALSSESSRSSGRGMVLEVLREMACTSQVRLCAPVMPALKKLKHKDYNVTKISSREEGFVKSLSVYCSV